MKVTTWTRSCIELSTWQKKRNRKNRYPWINMLRVCTSSRAPRLRILWSLKWHLTMLLIRSSNNEKKRSYWWTQCYIRNSWKESIRLIGNCLPERIRPSSSISLYINNACTATRAIDSTNWWHETCFRSRMIASQWGTDLRRPKTRLTWSMWWFKTS